MSKYNRNFMIEDAELELETEIGTLPEHATQEEKTYYKRYGDLRRHSQAQETKLQKQINDLENRLSELSHKGMDLPTSEDDIQAWITKYPDVAKIVTGIARRQASEATQELDATLKTIQQERYDLDKEKAQQKLAERHPDFFDTIRHEPEFHEWLGEQDDATRSALYDNDTDWKAASRVIADYKYEKGITNTPAKKERKTNNRHDALASVDTRGGSSPSTRTNYQFSESQISRMSAQEYEAKEDEIEAARQAGRINMDLTHRGA